MMTAPAAVDEHRVRDGGPFEQPLRCLLDVAVRLDGGVGREGLGGVVVVLHHATLQRQGGMVVQEAAAIWGAVAAADREASYDDIMIGRDMDDAEVRRA